MGKQIKHITSLSVARSGHNFIIQNIMSWFDDNSLVHHNLENIAPRDLMPLHLSHGGIRVLIYRDFDDWLASSIMKSYSGNTHRIRDTLPSYILSVVSKYFEIRQEAKSPMYFKNAIVIHYDKFVNSREYRKAICSAVGGEYSEDKINFVPANGHHSSFDGNEFQGRGSEMNVLNRSEQILDTEHKEFYLKILKEYEGLIRIHR
jgi:hypothetical protein